MQHLSRSTAHGCNGWSFLYLPISSPARASLTSKTSSPNTSPCCSSCRYWSPAPVMPELSQPRLWYGVWLPVMSQSPTGESCRSEEHTSELQSRPHLVCRLLLEKKKKKIDIKVHF